jgi:hypothetical protein
VKAVFPKNLRWRSRSIYDFKPVYRASWRGYKMFFRPYAKGYMRHTYGPRPFYAADPLAWLTRISTSAYFIR